MSRKSGIVAGIIAIILAIISKIPIFPPENWIIDFKIFASGNINFYFWGYTINEIGYSSMLLQLPENLLPIVLWGFIVLIGLNSILASLTKSKRENALLLYRINLIMVILILIIFGINIILLSLPDFITIFTNTGLGYYLTIIILVLNLIALKSLKKE